MDKLYKVLAGLVNARANCIARPNPEWKERHEERIYWLVKDHLPTGSGFDAGTAIDLDASTDDKLVFTTSFHHMDEHGSYSGWTEHTVTVRPSLHFGVRLTIGGRDRNEIKEYIHECFHLALIADIDPAAVYARHEETARVR